MLQDIPCADSQQGGIHLQSAGNNIAVGKKPCQVIVKVWAGTLPQPESTMKHCLLLLSLAVSAMAADTENWPQYRGANSDGLGEGATLPET